MKSPAQCGCNAGGLMTAEQQLIKKLRPLCKISGGTGDSIPATKEAVQYAKSYVLQVVREAVEQEPELPGSMPDEMWEIIKNDRHDCEESHRMAVRETKQNILTRIEKLTEES